LHWKKLFAIAFALLIVMLSVVGGYAEAQGLVVKIRSRDGSIYVDVSGSYTFPLPTPLAGQALLLNYSSLYIKPRLFKENAKLLTKLPPTPTAQPFALLLNATAVQVYGVGRAFIEMMFTSPNGTIHLTVNSSTAVEDSVVKAVLSGELVIDKKLLPQDAQQQLPMLILMLQHVKPEDLNKQLAMAGMGWLRIEAFKVGFVDLGASFRIPFSVSMGVDYTGFALTYNISLDAVQRYIQTVKSLNHTTVFLLSLTPEGVEVLYSATYMAEDVEKAVRELAMLSWEALTRSAALSTPPTLPVQEAVQLYENISKALTLYSGLALLPSNATAVVKVELGSVSLYLDVKNLRLTHRDGVDKATAAIVALADTLKSLGVDVKVESEAPCDESYRKGLAEANTKLVNTLLAGYITPTPTATPTTPPPEKTVTVTVREIATLTTAVTQTVTLTTAIPTTLTATETATKTLVETTTITEVRESYTAAATIGIIMLIVLTALGYMLKKRR
jgi:hypothetical protein